MASLDNASIQLLYALIDYEDPYVQPLILAAFEKRLPSSAYRLISSLKELPSPSTPLLQFVQYESIDWDHLMENPNTSMSNAYIIRKALIRKHYLSTTIANWITKYPDSVLKKHVKPSVEFEVDYAEFLDDALIEAWELKQSWARNEELGDDEGNLEKKEWWILKPGMSDRGQGIRLFSSEQELTSIFEEWDPESDDEYEEDDARSDHSPSTQQQEASKADNDGMITSQLRHFVAQPYIHPALLLPPPSSPSSDSPDSLRKFHIRTYVLAVGALKVYVYRPMLALFAAHSYIPPWDQSLQENREEAMKAHLTNTCLQDSGDREGSVGLFWDLPAAIPTQPDTSSFSKATNPSQSEANSDWKSHIFTQILSTTSSTFLSAARSMSTHFQPLPNAFEIFGLDFMVGVEPNGELNTYLLEVNAFPDFRQTGNELKGMMQGLFEGVVERAVGPFFEVAGAGAGAGGGEEGDMVEVLNIDLGRR